MNISYDAVNKIDNLAKRFTKNTPILCKEHTPNGLPIDKPDNLGDLESTHPSEIFNNIVQTEINKQTVFSDMREQYIKEELRSIFKQKYYQKGDERSCKKCYDERLEQEHGLAIRMVVPEKYDDIDTM